MEKKVTVFMWLVIANIANFFDTIFTLYATQTLSIEEANPIMAWALDVNPFFFVVLKLGLFALAIYFIAKKRPRLLPPVAILYILVVAWHILWLGKIL